MRHYCFGPYEVDLDHSELRKFGTRVSLQPQPFRVLVCLLEKSGQPVARAELQLALWSDGIHVDFERSLNRIVNKLRAVLGDDADSPKYIETIAGYGYRFIGQVYSKNAAHLLSASLEPGIRLQQTPVLVAPSAANGPEAVPTLVRSDGNSTKIVEVDAKQKKAPTAANPMYPFRKRGRWMVLTAAMAVLTMAVAVTGRFAPGSNPSHLRVVILPVANETGDQAEDYLAFGTKAVLTDELTRIAGDWLEVVEPPSTPFNTGSPLWNAMKSELRVDYVIEGSLSRASITPPRFRLAARQVRVRDNAVVWSASSECNLADATTVQRQLAESAVQALSGRLISRVRTRSEVPPLAQNEYLLGRYLANKRNKESTLEAAKHFSAAIQMDPTFTSAYLGVADAQLFLANYIPSYAQAARASLLQALQLDSSSAEAHAQLGFLRFTYDLDYQAAEREFRQALQLEPGNAAAHYRYGLVLAGVRRYPEAVEQMQRALELDPLNQSINYNDGIVLFQAGRTDDAIRQLQRTLELEPESEVAHQYLGIIFEQQKRYDAALDEFRKQRNTVTGTLPR